MIELEIKPAGVWHGAFSWDGNTLREHIKTIRTSYDSKDPRTWPLINKVVPRKNKTFETAPVYLAYEQSVMEDLARQQPFSRTQGRYLRNSTGDVCSIRFFHYPFNFNSDGHLRKHPHIPPNELGNWMTFMQPTAPDAHGSLHVPQAATTGGQETMPATSISSTSAFEQIMNYLTDAKTAFPVAMVELEEELGQVKAQCRTEEIRADEAESTVQALQKQTQQLVTNWRAKVEAVEEELRDLKAHSTAAITEEKKMTKAAEDRLNIHKQQLKESNDELATARNEAMEANERIVTVWTELRQFPAVGTWKRKTVAEATGPQHAAQTAACQLPQCESSGRESILLTKKLEERDNGITSLRRLLQTTKDALDDTKIKLTEANERAEAAGNAYQVLEKRADLAERERDNLCQQVKNLKQENGGLRGVDLSNKRARCESVPDEHFNKADKRAKRD